MKRSSGIGGIGGIGGKVFKLNNFFLHLAYIFLAFPFFLKELLYIRYSLEMAFICFILWDISNGYFSYTTVIWNSVFLGINTYLIVVELRQKDWNFFPSNPFENIGNIFDTGGLVKKL